MTAALNGAPPRKNLSDQLDRLDNILDGLAEAIPAVVAESIRVSVRRAVQEAIQEAISEVLANRDLLRLLEAPHPVVATPKPTAPVWEPSAPPAPSPEPALPGFVTRVCRTTMWNGVCATARKVGQAVASVGRAVWSAVKAPARWVSRGVSVVATAFNLAFAARRLFAPI